MEQIKEQLGAKLEDKKWYLVEDTQKGLQVLYKNGDLFYGNTNDKGGFILSHNYKVIAQMQPRSI